MDMVNGVLNILAPLFTFITLLLFLPLWLLFKFCLGIKRFIFTDDVSGKVVLITGASSGIGEHIAYEYARRGACLGLAARREHRLREVAERCRQLGSPDVIILPADVANVNDCRLIVDQTLHHFGRLDHLVNNAGISQVCKFEDADDITMFRSVMDINFWGSVNTTRFAAPHIRNTRGRIIVLSSCGSWTPLPRMSIYNASKAALTQLYETLRIEFGPEMKITIVSPGFIESEMTRGKFLSPDGKLEFNHHARDMIVNMAPVVRVEGCAKRIVRRAISGERYVTEPRWMEMTYVWMILWPEAVEWFTRLMYLTPVGDHDTLGKKILDFTGAHNILYPKSIQIKSH